MTEQYGGLYEMILARMQAIPARDRSLGVFAHELATMLDNNYTLTPKNK